MGRSEREQQQRGGAIAARDCARRASARRSQCRADQPRPGGRRRRRRGRRHKNTRQRRRQPGFRKHVRHELTLRTLWHRLGAPGSLWGCSRRCRAGAGRLPAQSHRPLGCDGWRRRTVWRPSQPRRLVRGSRACPTRAARAGELTATRCEAGRPSPSLLGHQCCPGFRFPRERPSLGSLHAGWTR